LRDVERAVNFIRTNAVLIIRNHPDRSQPLIKANRAIFHDRADLDAELFFALFIFALPHERVEM
jgi:hypothetical protein